MKFVAILGLFVSLAAHAEVNKPIDVFNSIKTENGKLEVNYSTGGGCATHTPKFTADVKIRQQGGFLIADAVIHVIDSADKEDHCEAMLEVPGSVDLKTLIKAEIAKKNPKDFEVYIGKVTLPSKITMN